MLKRFEVTNFKNFNEKFIFDLSDTKSYEFNEQCVENGIVKTGMIYGPNGCGKSNLGYAIFDIRNHLTDSKIDFPYQNAYQYAGNQSDLVEFQYTFQFRKSTVQYSYSKSSASNLVYEQLTIDDNTVLEIDHRNNSQALIDLKGAETLNKDFSNSNISIIKYVKNNAILEKNEINTTFQRFTTAIENFLHLTPVEYHNSIKSAPHMSAIVERIIPYLEDFKKLLFESGVKDQVKIIKENGENKLIFDFNGNYIDFADHASDGTLILANLFQWFAYLKDQRDISQYASNSYVELHSITHPFIFVDEFDAFFHHGVSKLIVKMFNELNTQVILTTHNTSIMTNDLLRPDCYFTMTEKEITPIHKNTSKELRKAHSLEKMYRAGAFGE